jgi:hypothetical protein
VRLTGGQCFLIRGEFERGLMKTFSTLSKPGWLKKKSEID